MINIFEYLDYRSLVRAWVEGQPGGGRGLYRKIAEHLAVSHVLISQVLNGSREMSVEQGFALAGFMGLTGLSRDYFLALVSHARAGTHEYRTHMDDVLKKLQAQSVKLSERLPSDAKLSEADKAEFYSDWIYSAIRLACALPDVKSTSDIAKRLSVPLARVEKIVDFLLSRGLIEISDDVFRLGVGRLHLEADSPFIQARQQSWRLRAATQMNQKSKDDLFYTGPMAISREHAREVREALTQLLEKVAKRAAGEPADSLLCLNIDLFEV